MTIAYDTRMRAIARVKRDAVTFQAVYGRRQRFARLMASPSTEVVIEGFPRSANTFSVKAFRTAQGSRTVAIAHHLHAPAQFQLAKRYGVPAICLVRDPVDAVASLIIREPRMSIELGLHMYTSFYGRALDFADSFVVCPFREATTDFGATIRHANERFGRDWTPFDATPANIQAVFEWIHEANQERFGGQSTMVAAPSADRVDRAGVLRAEMAGPRHAERVAEALGLYRRLVPASPAS